MDPEQRRPLYQRTLPAIAWRPSGTRVSIDAAADDLATYQVYRYCALPEALALLLRGEWTFARPNQWPDRYEQHISQQLFGPEGPFARVSAQVKCLSLEYASEALWRTYSGPSGVVRIAIRLQDLVGQLGKIVPATSKVFVSRVRYMDERSIRRAVNGLQHAATKPSAAQAMQALAMKRSGFAYENELRLCLLSRSKAEPANFHTLHGFDPGKVRSLMIDPYLPAWQAAELIALLRDRLGLGCRIAQSGFDQAPPAGS